MLKEPVDALMAIQQAPLQIFILNILPDTRLINDNLVNYFD
jgi:hypothetical protein